MRTSRDSSSSTCPSSAPASSLPAFVSIIRSSCVALALPQPSRQEDRAHSGRYTNCATGVAARSAPSATRVLLICAEIRRSMALMTIWARRGQDSAVLRPWRLTASSRKG